MYWVQNIVIIINCKKSKRMTIPLQYFQYLPRQQVHGTHLLQGNPQECVVLLALPLADEL